MARRQFSIHIGDEPWQVRYLHREPMVDGTDCYGNCAPRERVIRIWKGGTEHDRLDTLIHEWIHRRFPDFREESVLVMATQLADAILAQRDFEGD